MMIWQRQVKVNKNDGIHLASMQVLRNDISDSSLPAARHCHNPAGEKSEYYTIPTRQQCM